MAEMPVMLLSEMTPPKAEIPSIISSHNTPMAEMPNSAVSEMTFYIPEAEMPNSAVSEMTFYIAEAEMPTMLRQK
jgi:hypothetical protein